MLLYSFKYLIILTLKLLNYLEDNKENYKVSILNKNQRIKL